MNTVKFKCIHTGNVCEFSNENDIKTMRKHPEYTEVQEAVETEESTPVRKPRRSKKETTEE